MSFYGDLGMDITNTINELAWAFLDWKEAHAGVDSTELETKIAKAVWGLIKADNQMSWLDSEIDELLDKLKGGDSDAT